MRLGFRKKSNTQSSALQGCLPTEDAGPVSIAATVSRRVWVFVCTDATRTECVQRRLFGCTTPKHAFGDYRNMQPGDIIYLFNNTQDTIEGPFVALTKFFKDLNLKAWNGRFPWQVNLGKTELVEVKCELTQTSIFP